MKQSLEKMRFQFLYTALTKFTPPLLLIIQPLPNCSGLKNSTPISKSWKYVTPSSPLWQAALFLQVISGFGIQDHPGDLFKHRPKAMLSQSWALQIFYCTWFSKDKGKTGITSKHCSVSFSRVYLRSLRKRMQGCERDRLQKDVVCIQPPLLWNP